MQYIYKKCKCYTCKGCNNEDYPCEKDKEDPCSDCSNGKTISCTGYVKA